MSFLSNLAREVDFRDMVLNLRGIQYLQKSCVVEWGRTQRLINLDSKVNLIICSNLTQVHNSLTQLTKILVHTIHIQTPYGSF